MWPFSKSKYIVGSKKSTAELAKSFMTAYGWKVGLPDDGVYMQLHPDKMKDFVHRYHTTVLRPRPEVSDCDDFSYTAKSDAIRGSNKEGFDTPILFGFMTYKKKSTGRLHMVNVTLDANDKVMLYDPTVRLWSTPDDDIEQVVEVRF